MTMTPAVSTCSKCKRTYSRVEYLILNPPVWGDVQKGDTAAQDLILRQCSCHNTLSVLRPTLDLPATHPLQRRFWGRR